MQPGETDNLQHAIETLLAALLHPVLVEDGVEVFDLTAARWRLNVEFGKLIFSAWNSGKSISRRVEELAYRDRDRFGIFVRRPGAHASTTLEFRELQAVPRLTRSSARASFRRKLLALLERNFRGWKFERVGNRSDREHSFSARFVRGMARQGRSAWAFLGLSEEEGPVAADDALAFSLIWLDWLRAQQESAVIRQLKLFVPPAAVGLIAHRAAHLNPRAVVLEIYQWSPGDPAAALIDLSDYGNIETHLAACRQAEVLREAHAKLLQDLLGAADPEIAIMPDPSANSSSLRICGLEVARIEASLAPRIYFGLEGSVRRLDHSLHEEFCEFLREVKRIRRPSSPEREHNFYRLQSERWLESLLFRDITRIDSALGGRHVYSQVPAFSGTDRGIIDLLTVTRSGRLAVVELKVQEEINLPLQGLDYWLRVNRLQKRRQFREFGYFQDCGLSAAPPLLYLVSPAFRFHSTTQKILRYFDPEIEVVLIGIGDGWREEIKVLFRQEIFRSNLP